MKNKTINSVAWESVERLSAQIAQFILGIVLARILCPEDFGLIAMLTIFIAIAQTVLDSGFTNALICKKDRTDVDYCTVFYFNIAISIIIYIILFFIAPLVSRFYVRPELTLLLRVISLSIIIDSFSIVQIAKLQISMNFKPLAIVTLVASVISGVVAIFAALNGLGVWSLIIRVLIERFSFAVLITIIGKWKPRIVFSIESFKGLFSFGSKIMLSGLLNTIYVNLSTIVVGKFFSAKLLGIFSRGEQFAALPGSNIATILKKVSLPLLSELQNDNHGLVALYSKYIRTSSMFVFFVMSLLAAVAYPLVVLVLSPVWSESVIYLQIFCYAYMFNHISDINLNLLQVKGRSDLYLKLEIYKKILSTIILFASIPFGILAIAISRVVYTQIALFINTIYTKKIYQISYTTQLKDFIPYFIKATIACIPAYIISMLNMPLLLAIILGIIISVGIYFILIYRDEYFKLCLSYVKQK